MTIEGSTVTGNSAPYSAGILNYVGATLTLMEQHGEQQQRRECPAVGSTIGSARR